MVWLLFFPHVYCICNIKEDNSTIWAERWAWKLCDIYGWSVTVTMMAKSSENMERRCWGGGISTLLGKQAERKHSWEKYTELYVDVWNWGFFPLMLHDILTIKYYLELCQCQMDGSWKILELLRGGARESKRSIWNKELKLLLFRKYAIWALCSICKWMYKDLTVFFSLSLQICLAE